eukprot:SAG31_NODE_30634_length_378_cov_0.917563_1_plen_38_part_01
MRRLAKAYESKLKFFYLKKVRSAGRFVEIKQAAPQRVY